MRWTNVPTVRDVDKPFLMPIEDVFTITGRGTVATGRVERGRVKMQDEVEIVGLVTSLARPVVRVLRCSARPWIMRRPVTT